MKPLEEKRGGRRVYEGRILSLDVDEVLLQNGNTASREVVRHHGGVCVLAVDDRDEILFVRQFRYPYGEVLLELPAGKIEPGEDPAACGKRELEEETGHTAARFEFLARVYPSPGYLDEVLHLYLARDLAATAQRLDEDEFLEVEKIPLERAVGLCLDGSITDAKTLVALLKYRTLRDRGAL